MTSKTDRERTTSKYSDIHMEATDAALIRLQGPSLAGIDIKSRKPAQTALSQDAKIHEANAVHLTRLK